MSRLESLADAPGTSREYETIYILRPNCTNDQVADVNKRVRGVIEEMGGKILKVDNWGKRRLAYEVEKERKGIYLYWQYLAGPGVVDEFERNMRMLDMVIRYMTVKIDTDVVADARPTEVDDETFEKAANTAADEEDMYLRGPGLEDESDEDFDGDSDSDGKAKADSNDEAKADSNDEAKADSNDDDDDDADEAKADSNDDDKDEE